MNTEHEPSDSEGLEGYARTEMQRFLKRLLDEELERLLHAVEPVQTRRKTELPFSLSPRELEILHLLVNGLSNKQMAEHLVLSEETVKTHMRHIMEKLRVHDRTQAAVAALQRGIIRKSN